MAIQTRGQAVHGANLGLYYDRPPLLVPERGVITGSNFRITNGQITNRNVGWSAFNNLNLDSKPVTLIDEFQPTGGAKKQIFANTTDLFQYSSSTLSYLTPRYATGTASCAGGTAVTGSGTLWLTNGIKAGDFIHFGNASQTSPSAAWYQVAVVGGETSITLTGNGPNTGGLGVYTIRKTFTNTIFNPWLSETFRNGTAYGSGTGADRWYATNGTNAVVAWDGVATQVYLPNLGTIQTCAAIRRFKNIMVFVAPTEGGAKLGRNVRTSAIGQPENTSTLEAASFTIYDGADSLINAYQIGELLAIYAPRGILLAQYVGSPVQFVFRQAIQGYGPRSARGIARFPSSHIFFGADGQYTFDGVSAQQSNTHVWKDITRQSSPNRAALVQTAIDEGNAEMIWIVPLNSDANPNDGPPEACYTGHYLEEVEDAPMPHATRDMPATAIGTFVQSSVLTFDQMPLGFNLYSIRWDDQQIQAAFPQILIGTNTGAIYQLGAQNQLSVVPTSYVRFSRRPLWDSRHRATITRVYPNMDFQAGSTGRFTVNLRLFDAANSIDPLQQAEANPYLDGLAGQGGGGARFTSFRHSGRFVEVEIGSGPTYQGVWALEGYDMDVVKSGER